MINDGTLNNALTRGNKAEIAHWGIADYSSAITTGITATYTTGTNYTMKNDGFFFLGRLVSAGTMTVTVNNVVACKCGTSGANYASCYISAKKGDVIHFVEDSYSGSSVSSYEFPFIAGG